MRKNENYIKIYNFIINYYKDNCCAPTFREIGEGCDIQSTATIHRYIHQMEKDGVVELSGKANRTIKPTGMNATFKFSEIK